MDISGKKFGRLTAIEVVGKNNLGFIWRCKCDCGKFTDVNTSILNFGTKKSCGCLKNATREHSANWKGHGEMGKAHWNSINEHSIRHNRIIPFDLTIEQAWELFLKQDRKCAISGMDINFGKTSRTGRTASLDRKDSSKGYTIDNVWWVHKDVNYIKMDFTMDEFLNLIKEIYEFQQRKPAR